MEHDCEYRVSPSDSAAFATVPGVGFDIKTDQKALRCLHELGRASMRAVPDKGPDILDRCNQIILDLLTPEPSPARPFEAVLGGAIPETPLHQPAPLDSIPLGLPTVGLLPSLIDQLLLIVPLDRASGSVLGLRALNS